MKIIYKKVSVSYALLLVILLSFLSGLFKDVITLFFITVIHEIGHILFSSYYKWNIKKIDFTICGGFITYNDKLDKPFNEELLISCAGFILQLFLFFICFVLKKMDLLNMKYYYLINKYNLSVLLFNILPIYPLDGSKILFVFLNKLFPYRKSLRLINLLSVIFLFVILFLFIFKIIKLEYSYIMIIFFIIKKIILYIKDIPYLFNRFLYERKISKIRFLKYKYLNTRNLNKIYRQKKCFFKVNNHYVEDKILINKRFD